MTAPESPLLYRQNGQAAEEKSQCATCGLVFDRLSDFDAHLSGREKRCPEEGRSDLGVAIGG